jgi:hypothetical protein
MPVSIPINNLITLSATRVTGKETIPAVQYEGGAAYTYQVAMSSMFYTDCIGTNQIQNGSVTLAKLSEGFPTWSSGGTFSLSGNLEVGNKTSTPLYLSLGYDRAVAGNTSIFMYSDVGTIPDTSIVRGSGTNGKLTISNTGTGGMDIVNTNGAPLSLNTNNTSRIFIKSNGDIGIGTTTPSTTLDVNGAITSTSISTRKVTATNNVSQSLTDGVLVLNGVGGAIVLDNSGHKRLSWNDGGGDFNLRGGNYFNGTSLVYAKGASDSNGGAATFTLNTDGANGTIAMNVAPIGVPGTAVTYANTLVLDKDKAYTTGSLGVGTSTPSTKLEVTGTAKVTDLQVTTGTDLGQNTRTGTSVSTGDVNLQVGYNRTGNGASKILLYGSAGSSATGFTTIQKESSNNGNLTISDNGTGVFYLTKNNATGTMRFQTGGANDRITILADGKVGINTVTPSATLQVNGSVIGVSFNTSSSLRYKKNVKPLQGALSIVSKLNAVRFDWKETEKSEIGLIAEEVEKILPEFVLKNDSGEPEAIDYGKLTSVLIGAINELQDKLN